VDERYVEELFKQASEKSLVTRPFRDFATKTRLSGICFCCDDCCGYIAGIKAEDAGDAKSDTAGEEGGDFVSDKGIYIEQTDSDTCIHCGNCVEVCYFLARKKDNGELAVNRDKCYGCGLCTEECPTDSIEMAQRAAV